MKFQIVPKADAFSTLAPGGSVMDKVVFDAADEAGMVYCQTDLRLFTH